MESPDVGESPPPSQSLLSKASSENVSADQKRQFIREDILSHRMEKELVPLRKNELLLLDKWRTIFRHEKANSLKEEIYIFKACFERANDHKNWLFESLKRWNAHSEMQRSRSQALHMYLCNRLQYIQKLRKEDLKRAFEKELERDCEEMQKEIEEDRMMIEKQLEELLEVRLALETNTADNMVQKRSYFNDLSAQQKGNLINAKQSLRYHLEAHVKDIWMEYVTEHNTYENRMQSMGEQLDYYINSERRLDKELQFYQRRIHNLERKIATVKTKFSRNIEEFQNHKRDMKSTIGKYLEDSRQLRHYCQGLAQLQDSQLKRLLNTVGFHRLRMMHLHKVAERILLMAEKCRRRQNEEEKVLPFESLSVETVGNKHPEDDVTLSDVSSFKTEVNQIPSADVKLDELGDFLKVETEMQAPLKGFWDRAARAQLDVLTLYKTREDLTRENEKLKQSLKACLDQISSKGSL